MKENQENHSFLPQKIFVHEGLEMKIHAIFALPLYRTYEKV